MAKYKEKLFKQQKGITLITLIITIIVLLILAGVVFNTVLVDNGILKRTQQTGEQQKIAEYKQQIEMELMEKQIDEDDIYGVTLDKLKADNYVDEFGLIEIDGYIYEIDESLKVTYVGEATITISVNPRTMIQSTVNVEIKVEKRTDEVDTNSLGYMWNTNKTDKPAEDDTGWVSFNTKEKDLTEDMTIGTYTQKYLWIKAKSVKTGDKIKIVRAGPYCDKDAVAPTMTFTKGAKTETSEIINVTVKDERSGIVEIEQPDGTKITVDNELTYTFQYIATNNGQNTFKAKDGAGNPAELNVSVTGLVETIEGVNGIVADIRDMEIADGTYFLIEGPEDDRQTYKIKITNFREDVILSAAPTEALATTTDGPMVILKYHKNLTVGSGVTLTPSVRTKGMYVCVKGTLTNNGIISMTARGANTFGQVNQNVYLYKNGDLSFDFVPADGGLGGERVTASNNNLTSDATAGNVGKGGIGRMTGGGGSGGVSHIYNRSAGSASSGLGGVGSSWSGGSGGRWRYR